MGKQTFSLIYLFPLFFFFLFLIPSIQAAPPFSQTTTGISTGIIISFPQIDAIKVNQPYEFNFHLTNTTNGIPLVDNTTTKCVFHLYNPEGNHVNTVNVTKLTDTYDYELIVPSSNFSTTGLYHYIFQCNNTVQQIGGIVTTGLLVTPSGNGSAVGYYFLLFALVYILLFAGIFTRNIPVTILGGFATIILGLYTLNYGIDIYRNFATRGISLITICFGGFWAAKASLESLEEYNHLS